HDVLWRPAPQARCDRLDGRKLRHHADLDCADVEIAEYGIELRGDEIRRQRMNSADSFGVLRGQRRNDGGAVDAERGKGLEIGLNAGPSRGVRAGDGERDGRRHGLSSCDLLSAASLLAMMQQIWLSVF